MRDSIQPRPIIDVDYTDVETWVTKKPKKGDHIRVKRIGGLYAHHGIYVSDDEIIHFTGTEDDSILDWSKPEVIKSDLDYFLKDGVLEIKEYSDEEFEDLYSPEQIITYARACLGDKGYNLIFNNCEHFANVCTLGRFRSNQVERVFAGKLPNEEGKYMGILGTIGGAIKGLFGSKSSGSSSRDTTTYEPDKVKIAEIEAECKVNLAHMENERVELMKNAKLDILQFETESKIAIEEAKAKGLTIMAQNIIAMQEKLNEVAEKRLLIIEKCSLPVIKDIENFYKELSDKIKEDNEKYNVEKLPQLLSILENYEKGTPAHDLYMKRIEQDMASQSKHYDVQIESISKRQSQIIDSFIKSKDRILEQTHQITSGLLDNIQTQQGALQSSSLQLSLPNKEQLELPEANQKSE